MFYFIKIAQEFFFPFNLALIALIAGLICLVRKNTRWATRLIIVGLIFLVVPAMPVLTHLLLADLESTYPSRHSEDYPKSDAIVVLGGTAAPLLAPRLEVEEYGDGGRLHQTARLYHAKRAPFVVVAEGGTYITDDGSKRGNAEDMRDLLVSLGVPADAILLEQQSRNTIENAAYTMEILKKRGFKKILLVTNAYHLRRAVPLFERFELDVTPVPCGFLAVGKPSIDIRSIVPNPESFRDSRILIREYGGAIVQWMLGRT